MDTHFYSTMYQCDTCINSNLQNTLRHILAGKVSNESATKEHIKLRNMMTVNGFIIKT